MHIFKKKRLTDRTLSHSSLYIVFNPNSIADITNYITKIHSQNKRKVISAFNIDQCWLTLSVTTELGEHGRMWGLLTSVGLLSVSKQNWESTVECEGC